MKAIVRVYTNTPYAHARTDTYKYANARVHAHGLKMTERFEEAIGGVRKRVLGRVKV